LPCGNLAGALKGIVKRRRKRQTNSSSSQAQIVKAMCQQTEKRPLRDTIRLLIADHRVLIIEALAAIIGRQDNVTMLAKAARHHFNGSGQRLSA
jgi:limonene-1,2-epoxide hydrolase